MHAVDEASVSFTRVWSRMIELYRRSWKSVLAYSGMLGLVFAAIDYFDLGSGANTGASFATVIIAAGITMIVDDRYVAADKEEQARLMKAGNRYPPLIGASLLAGLGVVLGLVLLVIPGIVLGTWWGLHMPLIVREHHDAIDSLKVSRERVRGHVVPCALVWVSVWLIWFGALVLLLWNAPLEGGLPAELAVAEALLVALLFPLLPLAASAMYDLLPRPASRSLDAAGHAPA